MLVLKFFMSRLNFSLILGSNLKEQVEGVLNLSPSYATVVATAQLATQFLESAREEKRTCESVVHDQHLQQQGKV